MALSDERKFATFRRGKVRDDIILARFRNALRGATNPDTGTTFTEDEIAVITQDDSRFFVEADAIDLFGQAIQQRAIWFADQVRPERAASGWLRNVHGNLWLPDGFLDATGGSGSVLATASTGTIYVGSTTIGDSSANVARDPSGKQYQVLVTTVADANGEATLQMQGIDTGDDTNLAEGAILTWVNPPLGSDSEASVSETFTGGFNEETENEFAQRIIRRIRNKPGAGNSAQFRLWAQNSSNAVYDAFIYPTALHSGSLIVAVVQKRGSTVGPNARVASIGTLTTVTAYLLPPTSPIVPHGIHVLVTTVNPEPVDFSMLLSMPRGSSGGWTDTDPWPKYESTIEEGAPIRSVTSQLEFTLETYSEISGVEVGDSLTSDDVPALMVWNDETSAFETLDVASVTRNSSTIYTVVLNNEPDKTLVVDDIISPNNERAEVIAEAFQDYFDELGPSELVDEDDVRFVRAARFPRPDQEYAVKAGQSVISRLDDQLGGALSDAELIHITQNEPTLPNEYEITAGPNLLTIGKVGIYSESE